jgi:predicted amidophosphoribosyltransferase
MAVGPFMTIRQGNAPSARLREDMVHFQSRPIHGTWRKGYALDLHTISSTLLGYDAFGRMQFDTKRSEIGDLLYKLKYNHDMRVVPEIVEAVEKLLKAWNPMVDILVPVPPSTPRKVQPVLVRAKTISQQLHIPLANCVSRVRDIPQLKDVLDRNERVKLLDGLHKVDTSATQGKRVLLFDDLYRSGATMNAITAELYGKGKASEVFALTITRTRSNQ